jgi:hypothetical protein
MFEKLHTFANHLGLFSEEIGSRRGELFGNFSHLALNSAAYRLDRMDQDKYGQI